MADFESESLAPLPEPTGYFDPRAKLVAYLCGFGLILLTTKPLDLLLINIVVWGSIAGMQASAPWQRAIRLLWPTLLLFAIIGGLSQGYLAAAGAVLRLLALVSISVLFFATTPPTELGESLLASGLSPQAVFLLEGTLRFAPTMALLVQEVREAQESRGIRLDGFYLLRNGTALIAPLLADVMRFADDLAEALVTRGFGSSSRTPLLLYRFRLRDWLLVLAALLGTVLLISLLHHQTTLPLLLTTLSHPRMVMEIQ